MEGRPIFPIGTVLDGHYMIGHWPRTKYFQVVGHTKSGAPKVVELDKTIVFSGSNPCESFERHALGPNSVEIGQPVATRWSTKTGKWGVVTNDQKQRAELEVHVPGMVHEEKSYY